MDEALALPSEAAVRLALRTQQVLAYESGIADTADPLGGSFALERLTGDIEGEAEAYIAKIDGLGGSVPAIPFMQREIQDAAYRYQMEVETRARTVVGVNDFIVDEPPPARLFQVDPSVGDALARRLEAFRARRDRARVEASLERLERAARGRTNLVPLILGAVGAHATLGEICDRLRADFGVYTPSVSF
jgi:methylmalonyl-CoA mutase N-terminal domain/subunit